MKHYLFHHHTREELKALAEDGYAVVVPLAATEQHGPHLTVYTDSLICEHVSEGAVARATADRDCRLLLAPMLSIGCSDHHLAFGGTLSFSAETYLRMLNDIGESLVSGGFRKIIFLNAHGGNSLAMNQAANDLAVRHPVWTACASYWSVSREAFDAANATEVGRVPGHAGGFETSLILAVAEELVSREQIQAEHPERSWIASGPAGTFLGRHRELTGVNGYTDTAIRADKDKGHKYLEAAVQATADWLKRVYATMQQGDQELKTI